MDQLAKELGLAPDLVAQLENQIKSNPDSSFTFLQQYCLATFIRYDRLAFLVNTLEQYCIVISSMTGS